VLILLIIPLISYAILSTILIIYLLNRQPSEESPLEKMLDQEGDFKGATRQKQESRQYRRVRPDLPLPAHLRVRLDYQEPKSIQIGDLKVTPLKVELAKVLFRNGESLEAGPEESLVLTLHLRNTSEDVVFSPTDPYFDRRWKEKNPHEPMPYTYLELGTRRFHGGPLPHPGPGKRKANPETLEGQHAGKPLKPGAEMTTFVCTDPEDHVKEALKDYHGSLLWRVHVRRGLVRVGERDVSTAAVIGVEFTDRDIRKPG
jgi:hypothetical protein